MRYVESHIERKIPRQEDTNQFVRMGWVDVWQFVKLQTKVACTLWMLDFDNLEWPDGEPIEFLPARKFRISVSPDSNAAGHLVTFYLTHSDVVGGHLRATPHQRVHLHICEQGQVTVLNHKQGLAA